MSGAEPSSEANGLEQAYVMQMNLGFNKLINDLYVDFIHFPWYVAITLTCFSVECDNHLNDSLSNRN